MTDEIQNAETELYAAIEGARAAGLLVVATIFNPDSFFRYPNEMVEKVFAELNAEEEGIEDTIACAVSSRVHNTVIERLDAEERKTTEAEEAAEIAARTPEQWAAEVARLEGMLKDPESARVELTDYLLSELTIAKSKAATA